MTELMKDTDSTVLDIPTGQDNHPPSDHLTFALERCLPTPIRFRTLWIQALVGT